MEMDWQVAQMILQYEWEVDSGPWYVSSRNYSEQVTHSSSWYLVGFVCLSDNCKGQRTQVLLWLSGLYIHDEGAAQDENTQGRCDAGGCRNVSEAG